MSGLTNSLDCPSFSPLSPTQDPSQKDTFPLYLPFPGTGVRSCLHLTKFQSVSCVGRTFSEQGSPQARSVASIGYKDDSVAEFSEGSEYPNTLWPEL